MSKPVELLLLRNVENLGIVGDVVKVRAGFARNYLLPLALAEHPTPEKIEALKDARAKAQAELAALRSRREGTRATAIVCCRDAVITTWSAWVKNVAGCGRMVRTARCACWSGAMAAGGSRRRADSRPTPRDGPSRSPWPMPASATSPGMA